MASTYINHDVNGRSPHKNFKSNTITSACYSGIHDFIHNLNYQIFMGTREESGVQLEPHYGCCWFPQSFLYFIRLSTFGWPCNHWPYSQPYDI